MLPLLVALLRSLDFSDDNYDGPETPLPAHLDLPRVMIAAN
jgi:hypothetical protein